STAPNCPQAATSAQPKTLFRRSKTSQEIYAGAGGNPSVSGLDNGGFVSVWNGNYYETAGTVQGSVYDNEYNVVSSFSFSANYPSSPRVTTLANGNFAVVFEGADRGTKVQLLDPLGNKIGSEINVSNEVINDYAHVSPLSGGGFVVTWADYQKAYKQQFSSTGGAVESPYEINPSTDTYQGAVRASGLSDGGYIVVWDENLSGSQVNFSNNGGSLGVFAQEFSASGDSKSDIFRVNSFLPNSTSGVVPNLSWPSVSPDENGGYVVIWRSLASTDPAGAESIELENTFLTQFGNARDEISIGNLDGALAIDANTLDSTNAPVVLMQGSREWSLGRNEAV
ncbi:hypothetical protein, partial [Phaeobacter sp. SYSU ZJ3003]|uniref:hypothetical protein n=1 Tax=Phaeobacter sp. SYSU ZJ3003 TaxID=2109330 RepID=UPI00351C5D58